MNGVTAKPPYRPSSNKLLNAATLARRAKDETLDTLFHGALSILQRRNGYRFSLDAILLADFVNIREGAKVADLGTGSGVIPLILAARHSSLSIIGVELQEEMVNRASRNVYLNRLENRVSILSGDVCTIKELFSPETFAYVVCNPPYRSPASGRISPHAEKKIARHEIHGGLQDFLQAGAYLLPVKGRMALVYPAARILDLLQAMRNVGIEPKRLRMVHSFAHAEASLVLVEGVKDGRGGVTVLAPLVVYEQVKKYTLEVESMLAGSTASFLASGSRVAR